MASASAEGPARADPFELANRPVLYIDAAVDTAILEPVASVYTRVIPVEVRTGVHNALANLRAPYVAANDILQARPCAAADTATRFLVNSTIGIAGIFDVAARMDIAGHDNDLAGTLRAYGVGPGPYLVLPLLGPSDLRAAVARGAEFVVEPADLAIAHYVSNAAVWGRLAADTIDDRGSEDNADEHAIRNAADPYVGVRQAYWQSQSQEQSIPPCQTMRGESVTQ